MPRLFIFIASISLAFLAISSTCVASPDPTSAASAEPSTMASTGGDLASLWPSSEAPSWIVGEGLLTP